MHDEFGVGMDNPYENTSTPTEASLSKIFMGLTLIVSGIFTTEIEVGVGFISVGIGLLA